LFPPNSQIFPPCPRKAGRYSVPLSLVASHWHFSTSSCISATAGIRERPTGHKARPYYCHTRRHLHCSCPLTVIQGSKFEVSKTRLCKRLSFRYVSPPSCRPPYERGKAASHPLAGFRRKDGAKIHKKRELLTQAGKKRLFRGKKHITKIRARKDGARQPSPTRVHLKYRANSN